MQLCLIMDEVDGMSAGDRGGVADLIQTMKTAKLPIICICNDKYNQKLKSLRNHCLELDFRCASSFSFPDIDCFMYMHMPILSVRQRTGRFAEVCCNTSVDDSACTFMCAGNQQRSRSASGWCRSARRRGCR